MIEKVIIFQKKVFNSSVKNNRKQNHKNEEMLKFYII